MLALRSHQRILFLRNQKTKTKLDQRKMSSPNKRPRSEGNNTTNPQSPKRDRPHSSHNISFSQDVIYYYTPTTSPSSASPATPTTLPSLTQSLSPSVDDSMNDFSLFFNCSREMMDTPCEEIDKGDIRLPKMIPSIFSKGYRVDYGDYIGQNLSPVDLCSGPVTDVMLLSDASVGANGKSLPSDSAPVSPPRLVKPPVRLFLKFPQQRTKPPESTVRCLISIPPHHVESNIETSSALMKFVRLSSFPVIRLRPAQHPSKPLIPFHLHSNLVLLMTSNFPPFRYPPLPPLALRFRHLLVLRTPSFHSPNSSPPRLLLTNPSVPPWTHTPILLDQSPPPSATLPNSSQPPPKQPSLPQPNPSVPPWTLSQRPLHHPPLPLLRNARGTPLTGSGDSQLALLQIRPLQHQAHMHGKQCQVFLLLLCIGFKLTVQKLCTTTP